MTLVGHHQYVRVLATYPELEAQTMRRITYLLALAVLPGMALSAQNPAKPAIPSSAEVEKRVDQIIGKLNLEQKIDLLGGVDGFFIRDFNQLGWPRLRMADGPIGVRNFGPSTAYAAGIGLAASWDPELARKVGIALGQDARAKGVHFLLGPGVNIYRAPMNGRNFEYFGEDPWLASLYCRCLHPGRSEPGRHRHREALHGQQLGIRPSWEQFPD